MSKYIGLLLFVPFKMLITIRQANVQMLSLFNDPLYLSSGPSDGILFLFILHFSIKNSDYVDVQEQKHPLRK